MSGALRSYSVKFQHTSILSLTILGAIGVNSLTGVHYLVGGLGMVAEGATTWAGLIHNASIPALLLGVAPLASLMNGMEHQGNT